MSVDWTRSGELPGRVVIRPLEPAHAAELVRRAHLAQQRQDWQLSAPDRGWAFRVLGYVGPNGTIVDAAGVVLDQSVPGDLIVAPLAGEPVTIGKVVRA